ncbi:mfs multidrug transporter protein [Rutstroemia sp. NJR-2017a WRK4]|nr:mfs multidrug transporter protein [Rutstroemia sp. NJR-2017a WRK4]
MSTYAALVGASSELNLPRASTEYSSQYGRAPSPERPLNSGGEDESSSEESAKSSVEMEKSELHSMDAEQKKGWRFFGTFACLAILNFVCAVDATILSVALPTIATDIHATAIQAFWCGTSFLLCSTVFQPSWAAFSHIFGRKSVLLFALLLFSVGTIIASVAKDVALLLVGRCIQGIGGGGLVGLTYVLLADMVTLRERGKWMSIISLQWAIGSVIGPVIGGAFAEKATWRWIFWLNIPFCVISAVGIPICLRLNTKEGSVWKKLKAFDWLGSFLFIASTTSLLIPITWGGVMYTWESVRTLVPLLVGVGGLVMFLVYNVCISKDPLIRRSLFNSPTAIVAYFGTFVHGIAVWSLLFYMPLYFEVAKNFTSIQSGIGLFPLTFTTAPAAVIVGLVIAKSGKYRPSIWFGWALSTLGLGLLILLKESTSTVSWIFITLVPGIGFGCLFSAQGFAAQASASSEDLPFAGAMYSFFRAFGQTVGVAISGVIFQNTFKKKILNTAYAGHALEWSKDASAFVQIVKTWSNAGAEGEMKVVVIRAYVESLRMVWIVMCAVVGLAFLMNLIFIKEIALSREIKSDQAFDHGYNKKPAQSGVTLVSGPDEV